ncbi:lipocalin family protein [Limnohabitans sp. T6-20]|uniref:lipocalin family protein n=1 Tax=Limnohabitans sp. T6-20 TaxID=1100725 RepID=UPI000D3A2A48|nr:lipocalin family protein [Limnohabitans sp. T6-20]PUE12459.1 lipocalin [Limnohabitans sp. T6-20]
MTISQARAQRLQDIPRQCLASALWVWLALTGIAQAELAPLQTVPSVDVPRYMGTWYEIAKYPNWFQKKCTSSTQATYSLQADGRVQVLNRCKTDKAEWSEALGAARQIGGPTSAQLKVRFTPEWLSFIPMVWGDYWIIDLDPQYQWVLVSEPRREYLWVLSRTPQMPTATYQQLQSKLVALGFDLNRLQLSPP